MRIVKDRQEKKKCGRCRGSGKEPKPIKGNEPPFCVMCKGLGFVLLNQRIKLI